MIARPFLRIAGHEIDDWTTEWRGWFAALAHLRAGGCPVDAGGER